MPDTGRRGEATVVRVMDRAHVTFLARGWFGDLFAAYLDHVQRWESTPDPLAQTMMRQGLAAASLFLSCRPADEIVAWTINIQKPPLNLFLTGDGGEAMVTGRVITEGVRTTEVSRLFVESRRATGKVVQSTIPVEGWDTLGIFEQYHRQSEQNPGRFFELGDDEFLMALGLPETDREWVSALDRDQAAALYQERAVNPLPDRIFRFQCGCNPGRQLEVVRTLYAGKEDELFQGEDGVETFCPRCGRRWWIRRDAF